MNSIRSARGTYATIGHSVSVSKRASALNETARVTMRPSTSGSATFIAMSRAESPCVPFAQSSSRPPRQHDLEHGPSARVERGLPAFGRARRGDREPGRVEDEAHAHVLEHGGHEIRGDGIPEARHVEREGVHPAPAKGRDQRVDGSEVGGLHVGAVEDDGGARGALGPSRDDLVEAARPGRRVVETGAGKRGGLAPLGRKSDELGRESEQAAGVRRPPVHAVLPQAMGIGGRHGAERGEFGVGLVVAREEREGDRRRPAGGDDLLHAVRPVARAPQHPRNDELRARDHRLDMEVHRHRVGELHQVREAERGKLAIEFGARACDARELRVRGGEEDDVPRRLAEVDGLGLVDRRPRLGAQQVQR